MKDVRVPEQLMRAMAAEAEAARNARAKVISMIMRMRWCGCDVLKISMTILMIMTQ